MKLFVLGLDCATPEIVLEDDSLELPNLRGLMEAGCWGRLESVVPPITVPAWMCMATGRDPGSLGVYGFRNRTDHGYASLDTVDRNAFDALTIWDRIALQGGRSILVGVPPSYPPRRLNGLSVGCFLTPDPRTDVFTHPPELGERLHEWVDGYEVDVTDFRSDDKARIRRDVERMTRKRFEVVRRLMVEEPWDYFQVVEIGLDRIQHAFWKHHDPTHPKYDPANPWSEVVRDYHRMLDREIGSVLDRIDGETVVAVVSDHGARPLMGGFRINEWLLREGWLTLRSRPSSPTPFEELDVDWSRTRAWGAGGYYGRIFLNIEGREPEGTIPATDAEVVLEELVTALEATVDPEGRPLGTRAHRPVDLYSEVEGIPPDLIVLVGDLAWRALGSVGHAGVHADENDTGPDDCNHAQHGVFALAGPGVARVGELRGVHLLDVAPTLLELGGWDVPDSLPGRSFSGRDPDADPAATPESDETVRERLIGLGYIA